MVGIIIRGWRPRVVHIGHVDPRGAWGGATRVERWQTLKFFFSRPKSNGVKIFCMYIDMFIYEEYNLFMANAGMAPEPQRESNFWGGAQAKKAHFHYHIQNQ